MEVFISFSLLLCHFSTFYIHSFSGRYALPASLCPFLFYIVNYSRSKGILNRPLRGQKKGILPFFLISKSLSVFKRHPYYLRVFFA